jgi:D-beta-D-heptose 7-phosphate kinase/D-beta-D-heptose 1-phosphate adenosyltransferase
MISLNRFNTICSHFKQKKILVYGDLILDRYIFGGVSRISPEAPVPILKINNEEFRLGGAGNVSANIDKLGATAILMGIVGKDIYADILLKLKNKNNYTLRSNQNKTLVKTRVISQRQQMVRIDREEPFNLSSQIENQIQSFLNKTSIDGIIISDYAKGSVTKKIIEMFKRKARNDQIPIIVDPKPPNFPLYSRIDGITPNQQEAEQIINKKITSDQDALRAARQIRKKFNSKFCLITRGDKGITASESSKNAFHIPACSHEVFDVTGAGDTVASVLILALVSGATLKEAVSLANAAASIVIEKIGTSQVHIDEFRNRIQALTIKQ